METVLQNKMIFIIQLSRYQQRGKLVHVGQDVCVNYVLWSYLKVVHILAYLKLAISYSAYMKLNLLKYLGKRWHWKIILLKILLLNHYLLFLILLTDKYTKVLNMTMAYKFLVDFIFDKKQNSFLSHYSSAGGKIY